MVNNITTADVFSKGVQMRTSYMCSRSIDCSLNLQFKSGAKVYLSENIKTKDQMLNRQHQLFHIRNNVALKIS